MSEFDFGNARLRAARARLLSREALMAVAGARTLENMLAALYETVYRPAVENAVARYSGLEALSVALRNDLAASLGRQRDFYQGEAAGLVGWLLCRYDVYNVKTILRGVSRGAPPAVIVTQTIPVGSLQRAEIVALSRAESAPAVAGLLATWRSPLAAPLLDLAAVQPRAALWLKEMALHRWWARAAWSAGRSAIWKTALATYIDTENIITALRLVGLAVGETELKTHWIDVPMAAGQVVDAAILSSVARAPDLPTAVSRLDATPYGDALEAALATSMRQERVSAFESALAGYRVRQARGLFARDPLGIGVPLGYTELKVNESRNLRLIGHALHIGDPAPRILDQLVLA